MANVSSNRAAAEGTLDGFSVGVESVASARASEQARVESDRQWIVKLGQRWRGHHGQDLQLRFFTGATLNDRLGPPTVRLPRGEGVMALLAEESGLSESSLNRMRWFSHRFSSYEAFKASHPDIDSWDRVCVLLVELSQKEKLAETAVSGAEPKGKEPSKGIATILRALKGVAKALPRQQVAMDEDVKDELDLALRKLRRSLQRSTGLNVTISVA